MIDDIVKRIRDARNEFLPGAGPFIYLRLSEDEAQFVEQLVLEARLPTIAKTLAASASKDQQSLAQAN